MREAFTICTRSYMGLAKTLKESFLKFHTGYHFDIVIIDGVEDEDYSTCLPAEKVLSDYLQENEIEAMKFKYDVTEYSTSIKAFAFKFFFRQGFDLVAYFDPDIFFFSEFLELNNEDKHAFVTPHQLGMRGKEHIQTDAHTLKHGIYNCGFIAFRRSTEVFSFLDWWAERLVDGAYNDLNMGIYTDQKWIDFIPVHLGDNLEIIHNQGCNFAPWNYYERKLIEEDGFWITNRENPKDEKVRLCFAHFSGFNYNKLVDGFICHNNYEIDLYPDVKVIIYNYGTCLKENNTKNYLAKRYKYGYYSNGRVVSKLNRRIFRELRNETEIIEPFSSAGKLYNIFKKNGLISKGVVDVKSKSISNYSRKEKLIVFFLKVCYKILRVDTYVEFLMAMQIYSLYEKQIALLKKDYKE